MYHIDAELVWARIADLREDVAETNRLARLLHDAWREHLPCAGRGR